MLPEHRHPKHMQLLLCSHRSSSRLPIMPTPEHVAAPQGQPCWHSGESTALGPLKGSSPALNPGTLMDEHRAVKHFAALSRAS